MKTIVLISCVSQKLSRPTKAKGLYVSPLFKLSYKFAESLCPDAIYILSAKYGLVTPKKVISPYDVTLNNLRSKKIKRWSSKVLSDLAKQTNLQKDRYIFLAGNKYRKYLLPHIKNFEIPMKGLRLGKQLAWLKQRTQTI